MGRKGKKENEAPSKEAFDPLAVEVKMPITVVLLLSSPEEDILSKSCDAIYKYVEKADENKITLLGLGVLEPLCQLICHSNTQVRHSAFMALGTMSTNGDVKEGLKKFNVIPPIIHKLIPEEDTVVHEFATLCLSSLSADFICMQKIFEYDGLLPLIELLSSPDPDVKKNSLQTIYNMVQDYPSRLAVHELGGIRPILELLDSDFVAIQHLALKTLQILTTDKDTRETFREEEGFEKLMDILSNPEFADLHVEALRTVVHCLCDSESLRLLHKDGGLTKLMEFVVKAPSPEIQSSAAKCIAMIVKCVESHLQLHEQNVEKIMVELLSVVNDSVKTAACQALAAMSSQLAKDTFREQKGFPVLLECLRSESYELREEATQAIFNLTADNWLNADTLYKVGGIDILVLKLRDPCPRLVANVTATLSNMARQEEIRCNIVAHGAIPLLVNSLSSPNTQVQINTTQCLAVLVSDVDSRAELQRTGGLYPLVMLLQSHHNEVLKNTCWAVNVCATDKPVAVEMCKYGALEMLQEINTSEIRQNRFSQLAMDNLLKSNLSVKYSLESYLTPLDIITDGFYDVGKTNMGQRVLTLEELAKQPVNTHQAIIVINTGEHVSEEKQNAESEIPSKEETKTSRRKREEEKRKDDAQKGSAEKPWKLVQDVAVRNLVNEARRSILPLKDEREQYAALARLVSDSMGGPVEKEKLHEFSWHHHLSEVKYGLQSNIVPIGMVKKGIYCHRALLFKYLADSIGLSCTLVRGEYHRAWNEVLLSEKAPQNKDQQPQCRHCIVDLMHQPGSLLNVNTPAAVKYQNRPQMQFLYR
ncbi:armadillo repeat-containing protein 3 isoform X1 [Synchiropus splendidus]|uniref:armadillo repeat-containing protein 3 isoform X1 n=1 Tax=Synchiropus splendidus TaxID=270530 RepID=UPI00237D6731|nr:armadillo repeat-containing protein 3 isoform X1 [Synchiropus splendidus]XP_053714625.1 armadillo repeat-containing protein 3 isoform X1 [Synchiropus splendidus]XP_053714626.1 armadillo repeat-containing protein 3 isoform X1 [Synchiropus splendidus]